MYLDLLGVGKYRSFFAYELKNLLSHPRSFKIIGNGT